MNGVKITRRLRYERDPRPLRRIGDGRMFQFYLFVGRTQSGRTRSYSGVRHTGESVQSRQKLVKEPNTRFLIFVVIFAQAKACDRNLIGWDERIDRESIEQAANEDPCAREQDNRNRKLKHNQHGGKPGATLTR